MWDYQNQVLHHGITPAKLCQQKEVDVDIGAEYTLGDEELARTNKHWLWVPKEQVLKYPLEQKVIWVQLVEEARYRAIQSRAPEERQLTRQHQIMESWLEGILLDLKGNTDQQRNFAHATENA